MLVLFVTDVLGLFGRYFGFHNLRPLDFKTPIVSIGLFGTFFGVLVGLYGFDTNNITQSVPHLLEGLKFAFAISVLGMFLSLTLSILDKFTGGAEDDSEILRSIDRKMGGLVTSIESPAVMVREFRQMKTFLKEHLEHINVSLDQALQQLAKGATSEVIQALEKIITEFNRNLETQFGENFKELNVACHKLVEWQNKYRVHVDSTEASLSVIIRSLGEAREAVGDLVKRGEATANVCADVAGLIRTYDVQVQTLATYLERCKLLGEQAGTFLSNTERAVTLSADIGTFSALIQDSVGKQSEALAKLTKEIDEQMPKTLGELEKVLTSITNQFAADYRSLFQFITDKR
jgi:hypothetical protein